MLGCLWNFAGELLVGCVTRFMSVFFYLHSVGSSLESSSWDIQNNIHTCLL